MNTTDKHFKDLRDARAYADAMRRKWTDVKIIEFICGYIVRVGGKEINPDAGKSDGEILDHVGRTHLEKVLINGRYYFFICTDKDGFVAVKTSITAAREYLRAARGQIKFI